ncbi:MAG: DUF5596 domain-containing protein [Clostridiales bacterium]|nr:DUF5596 domain-containing protein [Clostridiales bacterium]
MVELMKKANFPADVVEDLAEKTEVLKKNGHWERIEGLAKEIMEELPMGDALGEKLKLAENWEEELGIHKYTLDLLLLLRCWEILEGRYEEKQLSMEIFYDTLDDMRCKLLECREIYGVNGIFVGWWYDRFFNISRFALGRLQFELEAYPYKKEYTEKGRIVRKGDTVINMHIPSSGPLLPEMVEDAFDRAAEFYKDQIPEGPVVFVVHSWMIDPDLVKILPEGNMKDFARRFTVLETSKNEKFMDGWRVFGNEWEKAPEELPRRTKLQKAIADYLQQGGKLGEGYGVIIR